MRISTARGTIVTVAGLVTALLLAPACGDKKQGGTDKAGSGAAGTGSAPGTGSAAGTGSGSAVKPTKPTKPAKKLEPAAVQAVVDAWLKAQNDGAFAEYEKLYAARMTGIKRVGLRTFRFDRKGWLKDRERMFKNKMTVAAKDPTIEVGSTTATVHFTQTFSQGKFKDEGPKEMLIALDGETLKIAREEMLSSRVDSSPTGVKMAEVLLVVEAGNTAYAVVASDADAAWGAGALSAPKEDGGLWSVTQATGPGLPKEHAAWNGRALTVHGEDGKTCKATVGALKLLAAVTPHFGTVMYWEGGDSDEAEIVSQEDIAAEIFGGDGLLLVAELGACSGVIATPESAKPLLLAASPADAETAKKAKEAFDALPAAKDLQESFEEFGKTGDWYDESEITSYRKDDKAYVVVVGKGGEGCGDWLGELTAVFAVDDKGALTAQQNADGVFIEPSLMGDVDGNGTIELVGVTSSYGPEWTIVGTDGGKLGTVKSAAFRYSDCPC